MTDAAARGDLDIQSPNGLDFYMLSEQRLNSQMIDFHFSKSPLLNALVLTRTASDSLLTMMLLNPFATKCTPSSTFSIIADQINSLLADKKDGITFICSGFVSLKADLKARYFRIRVFVM